MQTTKTNRVQYFSGFGNSFRFRGKVTVVIFTPVLPVED